MKEGGWSTVCEIVIGGEIVLLFSLANHSKQSVAPPQTLQYKKSCSVSFLHNSSRISIISDQI